mmetsp:Transcript_29048/g.83368  ORF Transcript_29048/g.83368 Transcript_29048/m.83368 type:complete len:311 (+) Transcript_29048:884-1816(+)
MRLGLQRRRPGLLAMELLPQLGDAGLEPGHLAAKPRGLGPFSVRAAALRCLPLLRGVPLPQSNLQSLCLRLLVGHFVSQLAVASLEPVQILAHGSQRHNKPIICRLRPGGLQLRELASLHQDLLLQLPAAGLGIRGAARQRLSLPAAGSDLLAQTLHLQRRGGSGARRRTLLQLAGPRALAAQILAELLATGLQSRRLLAPRLCIAPIRRHLLPQFGEGGQQALLLFVRDNLRLASRIPRRFAQRGLQVTLGGFQAVDLHHTLFEVSRPLLLLPQPLLQLVDLPPSISQLARGRVVRIRSRRCGWLMEVT